MTIGSRMPIPLEIVIKTPTPFMDDFLRLVAADARLDLRVHFLRTTTWRRPWKRSFGEATSTG